MIRGLVIGKFYPFHKGHRHLIETGLSQVDCLTVLVCDNKTQNIPAETRADWINESVPNVEIRVIPDIVDPDDSKGWADYTRQVLGYVPDVVFTSEDYGESYARFLGCRHVLVDKERTTFPISGTQIRNRPYRYWDFLEPAVKACYALRVCVRGAESSGTTTMARALATHYKTIWVPEYGREYWIKKMRAGYTDRWTTDEFIHIATEQNKQEEKAARECNRILVCDTDSFATRLWHERYVGKPSPEVDKLSNRSAIRQYFLTNTDIPFIQDGTRDGQHIRERMHRRFEEELLRCKKPFLLLAGKHDERITLAVHRCDDLLREIPIPEKDKD